jgi:hypothetical protein
MNYGKNLLAISLLFLTLLSTSAKAGLIDLGIDLGSEAEIYGSVASGNNLMTAPGVSIFGDACYQTDIMFPDTVVSGHSGGCSELTQLEHDIAQANVDASTLTGFELGKIDATLTLSASEHHVYQVSEIDLASGEFLTINGNANDAVVINIAGNAKVGSLAGILLSGGISGSNVLFNFINHVTRSEFNFGGADISGTFLATNTAYIMGDGATLDDVRFYTNESLQANVQTVRTKDVVEVPEPATVLLFLAALLSLVMRTNAKHH